MGRNYGAGGAFNGANIPLILAGPAEIRFIYDDTTHLLTFTPTVAGDNHTGRASVGPAPRCATSLTRERFYFVMADRFANGDTANDTGGLTGGRLATGFDPADKGFYHGGDLRA